MSWPLAFAVVRTSSRSPGQRRGPEARWSAVRLRWFVGRGRPEQCQDGDSQPGQMARALPRGLRCVDDVDGLLRGVRLDLCALIDSGRLQDVYFYMSAVAAVNVWAVLPGEVWTPRRRSPRRAHPRLPGRGACPAGGGGAGGRHRRDPSPAPEDANNPVAVGAGGERERRVVTHPFLEHDGPLAIAHRGGALDGRENSMAAFARAVELGYRYLETDVQVTADDVLVVFHDDRLDRVTDRPGEIGSLTWREVRAARIGGTDPIPLFADVLASWPDVCVNVDPKSDRAVGPLVRTIRAAGALDRVCVGSFSDQRLRRARAALGPRLCTSMGPGEVLRLRLAAWGLVPRSAVPSGPACAQIPLRRGFVPLAERQMLSWAHELGLPVHVWTVNDPVQMQDLLELGVDGIVSDDIVVLRAVLRDRGEWYPR